MEDPGATTLEKLRADMCRAALLESIGQADAALIVLQATHQTYVLWWEQKATRLDRQTAVNENFEGSLLQALARLKE